LKVSDPAGPPQVFTENVYDAVNYAGAYFGEGGLAYVRNVKRKALIEATLDSGWAWNKFNLIYIGVNKAALAYLGFDAAATFYPTEYLCIRPHLEFSDVVAQLLRTNLPWPTAVNCGLSVG
jgi:hypothetical protein